MILKLRFGFDDGRPRTLEEVGKVYNVTRERIRQIEEKALRNWKHLAENNARSASRVYDVIISLRYYLFLIYLGYS